MAKSSPSQAPIRMGRHLRLILAAAGLAIPLAGCAGNQSGQIPEVSADYRIEHPIVLTHAQRVLDVFPVGNYTRLDAATVQRIHEFAQDYANRGQGRISILVPEGSGNDSGARRAVPALRRALYRYGVRAATSVSSYPIENPHLAAPIRLTFLKLAARVANRCGEWPTDLASGSSTETFQNRPYHNYGCATQNELAMEIADPRDLASPAGETPPDTAMRVRAITAVRDGRDPGTKWNLQNTSISTIGAQ